MSATQTLDAVASPPKPNVAAPHLQPVGQRVLAFSLMCVGFFMATLDIQIVASSLREIGGGLSASQDELSWVQTAYLIAEIMVIPMSGWLSKVFSTRWLFAGSALGFTITSMLCGLAWDINSMIVFRALQGALGAAMIPTVFTTAFMLFPGRQRLIASTTIGALASLAPTIGPVIGGWITEQWSWHWLFYLNVAPGIAVTLLVPKYVHVDEPDLSLLKRGDYVGIVLMCGFLGCLEYLLEEGPRRNWFGDGAILGCTWISAICGFLFIVHALTAKDPIIDLRALAVRNFGIGSLLSFVTGIGIFVSVFLTPLFLAEVRGFSALQIGLALLSVGVFQLLALAAYAFSTRFVDMRLLLLFGLCCFGLGCYLYVPLTHDWGWQQLLLPQALRGIGQQFAVPPIVTMALGSLPPSRLKSASGLFNLMRNLGGAIGIAVSATMLNDRLNFHYLRLNESVTQGAPQVETLLGGQTRYWTSVAGNALDVAHASLAQLHALVMREALVMTFSDTFFVLALCFVVAIVSVAFSRPIAFTPPPADAH
ncbi:DHA2 family efflux MFS transporter permease subunit [Paraburkholderia caballeronis]|uniref:DHA2 family efflux MFS transporter permease subunit n=1 Tax=Paraburkholderia caballeronis TaxID=416943 RepID=UPI0010669369|nr:DHA2 family efflux MFS transporter permease subunit [Paraburkholderia caballeronis]TDV09199.1 DHA2 family multidrug resistance protein [Paraburkholderia caballeronis]TDV12259.1 DHA2 family multidrug resistance protein [Paraburkholderia caballeronis]TDV22732.1 DHA2 family multidrug resistance protein [Paraburkholderia caballeronis]